ncbi:MAG: hypothetical protein ACRDL2_09970 [Gaiellaceae bacterium]
MPRLEPADWWSVRAASNLKPSTYRCPLCGYRLHAMSPHLLIAPEGDTARRRHAHAECVQAARQQGRMPSYDEWRKTQPRKGIRLHWPFPKRP